MNRKIAAGFVIFRNISNKVEYLLLQTSYGIHHWTPPKGHLDPGENELTAAYRETFEEAGLNKEDIQIYEDTKRTLNYRVKGIPKTVHYWLAKVLDPNVNIKLSKEHQDFKWLPFREASEIVVYEDMQNVLLDFDCYINQHKIV